MPEPVAATRAGMAMALVFTLPLMLWLLGQTVLSSAGQFDLALPLQRVMTTALLLQSCSLALCLPWLMRFPAAGDRCHAVAMLLLVPGPLYAVAAMAGAVGASALLTALAVLAGLALLLHGVYAACLNLTAAGQARSLLIVFTQLILLLLCWQYRDFWLRVLSL